jgi:chitinase
MLDPRRAALCFAFAALLLAACKRDNPSYSGGLPGQDLAGTADDLAGGGPFDLAGVDQADVDLAAPVDLASADLTGAAYQLSVADTDVGEGNSGVVTLAFTVTLSAAAPYPVTFDYATSDGTARTDDSDYLSVVGRITLPAGQTSLVLKVPVLGDLRDETNETVQLTIANPINASIARATAIGVINDDDDAPGVTVDDAAGYEGGAAVNALVPFRVWLSAPSGRTITVAYATATGTASAADFTGKTGTLTFLPGQTEKQVNVPITPDLLPETPEAFTLGLLSAVNAPILRAAGTGTIYDDDSLLPVLSSTTVQVNEGDVGTTALTFTISTGAPVVGPVSFHATTHGISATEGVDYVGVDADFMIPAASNSVDITVNVKGDLTSEDLESFVLLLSAPSGATIATPMLVGRIKDDDPLPTLTFAPQSTLEGNLGATLQLVPLSLSLAAGRDVTVQVSTMGGTATSIVDYALTSGLLTIPTGVAAWTTAVPLHGDTTVEPDETYKLTATMAVNAKLAAPSITNTILNDD